MALVILDLAIIFLVGTNLFLNRPIPLSVFVMGVFLNGFGIWALRMLRKD